MTLRLVQQQIEAPRIRASARVSTVARLLDDSQAHIRQMIASGDLEAHRVGKRGIRVFLDSVEAWQLGSTVKGGNRRHSHAPDAPKTPSRATQAAHRQAVSYLHDLRLVPASRR